MTVAVAVLRYIVNIIALVVFARCIIERWANTPYDEEMAMPWLIAAIVSSIYLQMLPGIDILVALARLIANRK